MFCKISDLCDLCIENNYFTCGTTSQYEKMFEITKCGAPAHDIALIIYVCSEGVKLADIETKVQNLRNV